jgi:xanthine dehydrogenase accessory factor
MKSIFSILSETETGGKSAALCIVTETHGSTPAKAGAKMIVYEDGTSFGTIGGGNLEKKVIEDAVRVIASQGGGNYVHNLTRDHNMCCGGRVCIYIEPVKQTKKLIIFGAGHIGTHLSKMADQVGFDVYLVDERPGIFKNTEEDGINIIAARHRDAMSMIQFDLNTNIFICTHLHEYDRDILALCLKLPHLYLGMIGSRRKVEVTKKLFLQNSMATEEELAGVDMPAGINIGAATPAEIAVSIIAKIIETGSEERSLEEGIYSDLNVNQCLNESN